MARRRVIDPEFWLDEDLAKLTAYARLLYIGLWNICDDNYATLPDRPDWIRIQIFPYEDVDARLLLGELSKSGHIIGFEQEGKKYWFVKNFFKYQRIDRPSAPKYAKFPEGSASTRSEVKLSKLSKVKLSKGGYKKFLKAKKQIGKAFK